MNKHLIFSDLKYVRFRQGFSGPYGSCSEKNYVCVLSLRKINPRILVCFSVIVLKHSDQNKERKGFISSYTFRMKSSGWNQRESCLLVCLQVYAHYLYYLAWQHLLWMALPTLGISLDFSKCTLI